jgi:subtilase family serine protease
VWPLPAWQASVSTSANGESTSHRMVPDVSLDADPVTGYPIYMAQPGKSPWLLGVGGTSCAAPMWAAFVALVNQKLVANGQPRLGFANPAIYQVARSAEYGNAFYDVKDGSTNLHFGTSPDYDLATGWGTLQGKSLLDNLSGASLPAPLAAPSVPGDLAARAN